MTKRIIYLFIAFFLTSCVRERIAVVYENDVHCAVDGYTKFATVKDSLKQSGWNVITVSCGDFLSGGLYGNYTKGGCIISYMNIVGYDVATIGNHEFDFSIERMTEVLDSINCQKICCNFRKNWKDIYPGYTIIEREGIKIGFVGVTTPTVMTSSKPSIFMDNTGRIPYDFYRNDIVKVVQKNADHARKAGAKYIVLLSHLGDKANPVITSRRLIELTDGIDVVLDGHEHNVIYCDTLLNRRGKPVFLSSTGAFFKNIGILKFNNGELSTELIQKSDIHRTHAKVDSLSHVIDSILGMAALNRYVGKTSSDIITTIRNQENTLGDLVTDAMRHVMGAEIAFINSGFLRKNIKKGNIYNKDIYNSCPFTDYVYKIRISGEEILDMLEKSSSMTPKSFGGFMQVSGIKYSIDTCIKSSILSNEIGTFTGVAGDRRVHKVEILGKDGEYQPIEKDSMYTAASIDYILFEEGDGISFRNLEKCECEYLQTIDVIGQYIARFKDGNLKSLYSTPDKRITYSKKSK